MFSFIIPTYNSKDYLYQSLIYLSSLNKPKGISFEIIIVDDGSNDNTYSILKYFPILMECIQYIYLPRDRNSCRSRTRNEGIKRSSGEYLIFLDSGVLVPPIFLENLLKKNLINEKTVILHYVYGLYVIPDNEDTSLLNEMTPHNMTSVSEKLSLKSDWQDSRSNLFQLVNNDLNKLPSPWTIGYTCSLTVPKKLCLESGLFDEDFKGWGAEDSDFCYNLYEKGASFISERESFAFHLPHPPNSSDTSKRLHGLENRRRLHRKRFRMDTELLIFLSSRLQHFMMGYFQNLIIEDLIPNYERDVYRWINKKIILGTTHSLLIGTSSMNTCRQLEVSDVFLQNVSLVKEFEEMFRDRKSKYLLGCDTPYHEDHFDCVIVTDFFRLLTPVLMKAFFHELQRISKNAYFIFTADYEPKSIYWARYEELNKVIEELNFNFDVVEQLDKHTIFTLKQKVSS
ncbi:glycosyltransferase family 2 protein [Paenibacillus tundrae]